VEEDGTATTVGVGLMDRLYEISHVTFMIAAGHFISEFLIFRTVKINRASIWPLLIGSESISELYSFFERG